MCDLEKALNLDNITKVFYNGKELPTAQQQVDKTVDELSFYMDKDLALTFVDAILTSQFTHIKWER